MLTLHRAALLRPDPASPTAPSLADGAVLVQGERIAALGPYPELAAAHPAARLRDWGHALLVPGLRNPYGRWLLEHAYHPDPREGVGSEPVPGGVDPGTDETRCGASARRGLQRMLGFGVTAVAGPFDRVAVRTAVARSGLHPLGGVGAGGVDGAGGAEGAEGPLDPLVVLPLDEAVHGVLTVGGRADFAVFGLTAVPGGAAVLGLTAVPGGAGQEGPGECLATVLGGRLVYRRR
ncbi:amidohydrolase family protein [Kitasatospora sp. NPDC004240]